MDTDLQLNVLHWVAEDERWEDVAWDDWLAFRGFRRRSLPLPRGASGVHHFMVVVTGDDGRPVNLIPHKYLIEPDGHAGHANFEGLNKEERADYDRIFVLAEFGPGDRERYDQIMEKLEGTVEPPHGSVPALKQKLPSRPFADTAAADFLNRFS